MSLLNVSLYDKMMFLCLFLTLIFLLLLLHDQFRNQ